MTRTLLHMFGPADYREEAAWLGEQHAKGLALTARRGLRYEFAETAPEQVAYEIHRHVDGSDDDVYIQMFADEGWDFVLRAGDSFYFRRPGVSAHEPLDVASQKDLLRALDADIASAAKMLPVALGGGLLVLIVTWMGDSASLFDRLLPLGIFLLGSGIVMAPIYLYYANQRRKLRAQFGELSFEPDAEWGEAVTERTSPHQVPDSPALNALQTIMLGAFMLGLGFAAGYAVMLFMF